MTIRVPWHQPFPYALVFSRWVDHFFALLGMHTAVAFRARVARLRVLDVSRRVVDGHRLCCGAYVLVMGGTEHRAGF